jgi:sterol 3beta-glucosyltransferase
MGAFVAGIPTIIKPFFGDQFFWADRVEALGIGAGVRKLTVESLTEALLAATTNQKQIDKARIVGKQIRSVGTLKTSVQAQC